MERPLVSIIMPAYNCESTILGALESVRCQTYSNWELLIHDDGSTDKTAEKLSKELQRDSRVTYSVFENNSGASAARNSAIQRARGVYVCFLDADDYWLPHKLQNQLEFMEAHGHLITATLCFRQNVRGIYFSSGPSVVCRRDLLKNNSVPFLSVMYRKQEFDEIRLRDLRSRNDLMFLLDCLANGSVLHILQKPLCVYREGTGSLSARRLKNLRDHWQCLKLGGVKKRLIPLLILSVTVHSLIKRKLPFFYNYYIAKA